MKYLILVMIALGLFAFAATSGIAIGGLVGYWSFDEETVSKDKVEDLSDNGNDGVINGNPEVVEGKFGQALNFIAGENYVEIPHSETLDRTDQITLAAWINPGRTTPWQSPLGKGGGKFNWCYSFYIEPDATMTFELGIIRQGDTPNAIGVGNHSVEVGTWYHAAGTYDGKTIKFYVDGNLEATTDVEGTIYSLETPLKIGRRFEPTQGIYAGMVDEVMIFSKALTDAEIKEIMQPLESAVTLNDKLTTTWGLIKGQ